MNISAIKKRCIEYGECVLVTNGEMQWIGTGKEFYPVHGVHLTAEGIPGLFGLTQKEQGKMEIREAEDILLVELAPTQQETDEMCCVDRVIIQYEGGTVRRISTCGGDEARWIWMNSEVPAKRKGVELLHALRGGVVVLLNGMLVEAVIAPMAAEDQRKLEKQLRYLGGEVGENLDELS